MDRKIGLFSARAFSKVAGPHGSHCTGLWACCRKYGLFSSISAFVCTPSLWQARTESSSSAWLSLANVNDEIDRGRRVPHSAQEARHLTTMMRTVIDDVKHGLPEWLSPLLPFQVFVGDELVRIG